MMKHSGSIRSGLFFIAFAVASLSACRQVHEILPDHPQMATGVRLQDVSFSSVALGREMTYRVFLPSKLAAGEKLPVVYLLHGGGGSFRDWSNYSSVSNFALQGLILVMPEGESSYYLNAAGAEKEKFEDFITHDLIADGEARFPVRKDRAGRAIVGVSMGGYAAVEYALSRPDLFAFAGGISPAIDVPSRHFSLQRAEQGWRFRRIFGPAGSKERQARDPFVQVNSADPAATPYLYLTAGEQEALAGPNRRFAKRLGERRFAYEFHTKPGGHDWTEWETQMPGCFASLMEHLPVKSN